MLTPQQLEEAKRKFGQQQITPSLSPRMQRLSALVQEDEDPRASFAQEEEKPRGFFSNVARSIVGSGAKLAATAGAAVSVGTPAAKALYYKATGNKAKEEENVAKANERIRKVEQGTNVPIIGNVKPIASAKEAVGVGLDLASNVVGASGVGNLAKTGLKGAIYQTAKAGAKSGLATGFLAGTGTSLEEGDSVRDSLISGATSGTVGAIAGGAIGGITGGISKIAQTVTTPKAERIVEKRLGELQKVESSYAPLRSLVGKAKEKGYDLNRMLAETDLLHGTVDKTGTIRTQGAIDELNQFLKPQEDVISVNLQKEGRKIPIKMVENRLRESVNEAGLKGAAKVRALRNVLDEVEGLKLEMDKDGYIPLSIIHDAKVDKYANINYLVPESKRADKAIAKGLKELVERNSKSIDVKSLNEELSRYYMIQSYLEKLEGKKVDGGRLGKYFAQVLGASIGGSVGGPAGAVAGTVAGDAIKGAAMASKFKGKAGKLLESTPLMKAAIEKGKKTVINL